MLVVVDPTVERQPAFERAAWLAAATGASLELFVCEDDPSLESNDRAREALLDHDRVRLEDLARPLAERGIATTVDARWERPLYKGILHKVEAAEPSLVVKDTHYHSAIKRTLLTNTDWNLIRHCTAPLLLVKDRDVAGGRRTLAAVDPVLDRDKPADLDARIIALARALCTAAGGDLHTVHAYMPIPTPVPSSLAAAPEAPGITSVTDQDAIAEDEERHRVAFEKLMRDENIDADHSHLLRGKPERMLVACAERFDADFVVMGAVSRGRLRQAFIGHTAERVLDRLPCDLLVVKPAAFSSAVPAD